MTAYRRIKLPGRTYFFTVALADRNSDLLVNNISSLRRAYALTQAAHPFHCDAMVVLPDHIHAIWTLPEGDADYGTRWGALKSRFTRMVKGRMGFNPILRSASKVEKGDAGVWQRRFWEHCIRDEADFALHMRYCWLNPVKHGLVENAVDWPFSSIHRDMQRGRVELDVSSGIPEGAFGERKGVLAKV